MNSIRILIVGLEMVLAFGTAPHAAGQGGNANLALVKTVAVVSALGDRAEIKNTGLMVFGNQLSYLPISDWRLDEMVASEVRVRLSGRLSTRRVEFNPSALARIRPSLIKNRDGALSEIIRAMPPIDVDAYLVLLADEVVAPYPSNQSLSGLGLYRQPYPNTARHAGEWMVHVIYSVYLVDARSGRIVKRSPGRSVSKEAQPKFNLFDPFSDSQLPFPHFYAPETTWPIKADAMTDYQKDQLRDSIGGLLIESVDDTLPLMGLGASPPSHQ